MDLGFLLCMDVWVVSCDFVPVLLFYICSLQYAGLAFSSLAFFHFPSFDNYGTWF
jgi:hypothetical protein